MYECRYFSRQTEISVYLINTLIVYSNNQRSDNGITGLPSDYRAVTSMASPVYRAITERSRQWHHRSTERLQSGHVNGIIGLPSDYRAVTSMTSLVYRAITERSRQWHHRSTARLQSGLVNVSNKNDILRRKQIEDVIFMNIISVPFYSWKTPVILLVSVPSC